MGTRCATHDGACCSVAGKVPETEVVKGNLQPGFGEGACRKANLSAGKGVIAEGSQHRFVGKERDARSLGQHAQAVERALTGVERVGWPSTGPGASTAPPAA